MQLLPPHTKAEPLVRGRHRGSRLTAWDGQGAPVPTAWLPPKNWGTQTRKCDRPEVKTKHKTPYFLELYKELKVKEKE